jgi:hypothetical protein
MRLEESTNKFLSPLPVQPTGNVKGVLLVEKEDLLEGKIDSLMRRLEKMEIEKKEAQDLKAAEARFTCEECGEYGHFQKDCPEEVKMLYYMRKGDLPNFRYGQGRPQFNATSSILNSVPLRMQLKDFMDEQAKINKDTVTKFKATDKVLENIDSKVTEVGSSNHQVLNMMKMLETQLGQLVGRLSANEGKLPGQPQGPEMAKAIQTHSGKETEDLERSARARKPRSSTEAEEFAKENVIITEEPEFEMPGEDTKIPQLKPRYIPLGGSIGAPSPARMSSRSQWTVAPSMPTSTPARNSAALLELPFHMATAPARSSSTR